MKKLCVAANRRQLITQDGAPFYLIGDTAWELFHRLNREEAEHYLTTRKSQGYNMMQSGHGYPSPWCFDMMASDYAREPVKPVMDGEPCYEDHPINFQTANGYYDDYNVRVAAYRNLLGGACGNTYGHHGVWCMRRDEEVNAYFPNNWKTALHRPGALQIAIYRDFASSHMPHDYTPVYDIVEENTHDANYVAAMVKGDEALLSIPTGYPIILNAAAIPFKPNTMVLFDPKTGTYSDAMPVPQSLRIAFPQRPAGRNCDYILILKP